MNYDIGHIKEMSETLIIRDEFIVIQDVHIQMDAPTARKLASVLCSNKVTRENQKLFFTSVMIDKKDLNAFTKGQSGMVRNVNRYIITTTLRTLIRFKGIMLAIVKGDDGVGYACDIEIESIDFNIVDIMPRVRDNVVFPAMIYPSGRYQAIILQD